jgi:hypothetical protein
VTRIITIELLDEGDFDGEETYKLLSKVGDAVTDLVEDIGVEYVGIAIKVSFQ